MKRLRIRSLALGLLFTVSFLVLVARLYWIQTVDAGWLMDRAQKMWEGGVTLQPKRGTIYDRNNNVLAYNAPAYTVAADPTRIENPGETARILAPVLQMSESKLLKLLTKPNSYQVELRNEGWKIDSKLAEQVKALQLEGIILIPQSKRYYPNERMAAHILGFYDKEEKARMGIEVQYDSMLRGTAGSVSFVKDAKGVQLPDSQVAYTPVVDGANLVLTIDQTIQHYIERALDEAERKYQPRRMVAIAVDPKTNDILGMSVRPTFNPNRYWDSAGDDYKEFYNHAIASPFEPGSTFKIVTLAAAIEEGVFKRDATYKSGQIKVPGYTISDWRQGGWGEISYLKGVQQSSNVLFVKLGLEELGWEKLFSYVRKFGFAQKTNIDLSPWQWKLGLYLFPAA